jgi:hypothetical protein
LSPEVLKIVTGSRRVPESRRVPFPAIPFRTFRKPGKKFTITPRVARWYLHFPTKYLKSGNLWRTLEWKRYGHFEYNITAILYIMYMDIYEVAIWYISPRFGIVSGKIWQLDHTWRRGEVAASPTAELRVVRSQPARV